MTAKEQVTMTAKEKVKIFIPPSRTDEEDIVVGVQGKLYQIPRGKEVEVPIEVKAEYERSILASQRRYENAKKIKELGN